MNPINNSDSVGRRLEEEAKRRKLGNGASEESARALRDHLGSSNDIDDADNFRTRPQESINFAEFREEISDLREGRTHDARPADAGSQSRGSNFADADLAQRLSAAKAESDYVPGQYATRADDVVGGGAPKVAPEPIPAARAPKESHPVIERVEKKPKPATDPGASLARIALWLAIGLTVWQGFFAWYTPGLVKGHFLTSFSGIVSMLLALAVAVVGGIALWQKLQPRWAAIAATAIGVQALVIAAASWAGSVLR